VNDTLLELDQVSAGYGETAVLRGIGFTVAAAGVTALLGANGAGKTTTLRAISGMLRSMGAIRFQGRDIRNRPTEEIARAGIAHVPDGRGTFKELTVEENLRLGACSRRAPGLRAEFARMFGYFPVLRTRFRQQAGTLSGGEQQMLAIARALLLRPRLLLLDEPSFGLAPLVVRELFAILARIRAEEGIGILLVEQNAAIALALADHAVLLETGRVVISGPAAELARDAAIRRAYLGY
jgi:branched-chain amino acid transport system ATP-binding protein